MAPKMVKEKRRKKEEETLKPRDNYDILHETVGILNFIVFSSNFVLQSRRFYFFPSKQTKQQQQQQQQQSHAQTSKQNPTDNKQNKKEKFCFSYLKHLLDSEPDLPRWFEMPNAVGHDQ